MLCLSGFELYSRWVPLLFAQVSADSIRTHACSRIKYIVFYYSEQLIANVTPCFLQDVQFSFGLLCMVRGFARS